MAFKPNDTPPANALTSPSPQEQGASLEPQASSAPQAPPAVPTPPPAPIYVTAGPQPLSPEQAAQQAQQAAQIQQEQNNTTPGGVYLVNGQKVDANGEPVRSGG